MKTFLLILLAGIVAMGVWAATNDAEFRRMCQERGGVPYMKAGAKTCLKAETIKVPGF